MFFNLIFAFNLIWSFWKWVSDMRVCDCFFFVLFKKASDNIIYFKTDTDYLYVAFIIYSYFHLKKKTKTKRLINQKFITNKLIEEVKREKTLWLAALFCKLLAEFLLFFVIVFFFYSIYIYVWNELNSNLPMAMQQSLLLKLYFWITFSIFLCYVELSN